MKTSTSIKNAMKHSISIAAFLAMLVTSTGCSKGETADRTLVQKKKRTADQADFSIPKPKIRWSIDSSADEAELRKFTTNTVEGFQRIVGEEYMYFLNHNHHSPTSRNNLRFIGVSSFKFNGYSFDASIFEETSATSSIQKACLLSRVELDEDGQPYSTCPVTPAPHGVFEVPGHIGDISIIAIDNAAFFGCSNITHLILPDTIRRVGIQAFTCCKDLNSVEIPPSVSSIGIGCFANCPNLINLSFSNDTSNSTEIEFEDYAFFGCGTLEHVDLPQSLISIGNNAFENCGKLGSIHIPSRVDQIGERAFANCTNLVSVTISARIGQQSVLPHVGKEAFADCKSIQELQIPCDGYDFLGDSVFSNAFSNIGSPSGINRFGNYLYEISPDFSGKIEINEDDYVSEHFRQTLRDIKNPFSLSINQARITDFSTLTNLYELVLGTKVERVGRSAFQGAVNLTNVVFQGKPSLVGENAFRSCDQLRSMNLVWGNNLEESLRAYPFQTLDYSFRFADTKKEQFTILLAMFLSIVQDNSGLGGGVILNHCYRGPHSGMIQQLGKNPLSIIDSYDSSLYVKTCQMLARTCEQLSNLIETDGLSDAEVKSLCLGSRCIEDIIAYFEMGKNYCYLWDSTASQKHLHIKIPSEMAAERSLLLGRYQVLHSMSEKLKHPCSEAILGMKQVQQGDKMAAIQHLQNAAIGWAESRCPLVVEWNETDDKIASTLQQIDDLGYRTTAELVLQQVRTIMQSKQGKKSNHDILFGTAWFINDSTIVTCHHVIEDCKEIWTETENGTRIDFAVLAEDPNHDIVILKAQSSIPKHSSLPLSSKLGSIASKVFTVGYPLPDIMGSEKKYNDGTISALSGIGNDNRFYQVSIPIQPGNSGGAVVSEEGLVIGLAAAALDAEKVFKLTGSIPQNVNYAIKSRYITALLQDNGIPYEETPPKSGTDPKTIVDQVSHATILLKAK